MTVSIGSIVWRQTVAFERMLYCKVTGSSHDEVFDQLTSKEVSDAELFVGS